jgi:hypothetical protein
MFPGQDAVSLHLAHPYSTYHLDVLQSKFGFDRSTLRVLQQKWLHADISWLGKQSYMPSTLFLVSFAFQML